MTRRSKDSTRMASRFLASVCASILLLGCAEGREPEPTPTEDGGAYNMIPPVPEPSEVLDGSPGVVGEWRQEEGPDSLALLFQRRSGEPVIRLACDSAGGLLIDWLDVAPVAEPRLMIVQAGDAVGRLATNEISSPRRALRATVPANHELMPALATGTGMLSIGFGTAMSGLPLTPATAELVRNCERLETPGAAGSAAP